MRSWTGLLAAGWIAASGQATSGQATSGQASVSAAIAELVREAEAIVEQDADPPRTPDFAGRHEFDLEPLAVGRALATRAHRDPFVDAYVRWQLAGVEHVLPDLDERAFDRLLESLPRLPENPRADRRLLATMSVLRGAGPIPTARQATIRAELDQLAARAARAEARCLPARDLRRRLASRFDGDPARRLDLELETIAALVAAGWPCAAAKSRLDDLCVTLGREAALDAEDRATFGRHAGRLAGRRRSLLAGAAFRENVLEPVYDDTAVDDFEVRRWIRAVDRAAPP